MGVYCGINGPKAGKFIIVHSTCISFVEIRFHFLDTDIVLNSFSIDESSLVADGATLVDLNINYNITSDNVDIDVVASKIIWSKDDKLDESDVDSGKLSSYQMLKRRAFTNRVTRYFKDFAHLIFYLENHWALIHV